MSGAWAAAAHRGELEMFLMSRARAIVDGYGGSLREGCPYLAIIRPDDLPTYACNFLSLAAVGQFVHAMAPREITFATAEGEDNRALREALDQLAAGEAVH
jgi:hypothetical protein